MLHQYFQQNDMHPFLNSMERPVRELMELNARTMQRFAYLMPSEMLIAKKPEQMMAKNIEMFMESSQTALTYMQNIFGIMERHMLSNIDTMAQKTKSPMSQPEKRNASATTTAKKVVKPSMKKAKTVTSKAKLQSEVRKTSVAKSAKSSSMIKSSSAAKKQAKPATDMKSKPTAAMKSKSVAAMKSKPVTMKSKESVKSSIKPQMVAHDMKKPSGALPSHFSSSPSSMKPAVGPNTTK